MNVAVVYTSAWRLEDPRSGHPTEGSFIDAFKE